MPCISNAAFAWSYRTTDKRALRRRRADTPNALGTEQYEGLAVIRAQATDMEHVPRRGAGEGEGSLKPHPAIVQSAINAALLLLPALVVSL